MRKFLIISHGAFAQGIQQSLSLFLGANHAFDAISAYLDDTPAQDLIDNYMKAIKDEDELIILSDIAGGSVNQLMLPYLNREHTFIIAGFNFPLLLELSVLPEDMLTKEQLQAIVHKVKDSMQMMDLEVLHENDHDDDE